MAALIGLDDDQVRDLCATCAEGETLEAVNFNAPGQVVIAGSKAPSTARWPRPSPPAPSARWCCP
jgi:malonyl CoA-acyl carrier protein transacylase